VNVVGVKITRERTPDTRWIVRFAELIKGSLYPNPGSFGITLGQINDVELDERHGRLTIGYGDHCKVPRPDDSIRYGVDIFYKLESCDSDVTWQRTHVARCQIISVSLGVIEFEVHNVTGEEAAEYISVATGHEFGSDIEYSSFWFEQNEIDE